MIVDLTLELNEELLGRESLKEDPELVFHSGHLGTHLDAVGLPFPLDRYRLPGRLVEVPFPDRPLEPEDLGEPPRPGEFVLFHTGFLAREGYGTETYVRDHPELSPRLVGFLLDLPAGRIGIDAAGIRRGKEHGPADRLCASRGVFVVENLAHLDRLGAVLRARENPPFSVVCLPLRAAHWSGLPCRVLAEVEG